MTKIEIIFTNPRAEYLYAPQYATVGSAGMDLRALEHTVLHPGETIPFSMGYRIYIGDHTLCGLIVPRSGLGIKGIMPANVLGLIDSDYQGELMVYLKNHGDENFIVESGDRIAQLVIMPVESVYFSIVSEFKHSTDRGEGGFGSTGEK